MIAVIFEVEPRDGHASAYFDLAGDLKPLVEGFDGFISVERFEAVLTPGRFLSLSFWRDEEAVQRWRKVAEHRLAQTAGRTEHFSDYRIRIAHVIRDYGMNARDEAPEDLRLVHG